MSDALVYQSCSPRVAPEDVRACCVGIGATSEAEGAVPDAAIIRAIDEALELFDLATDFAFRGECETTIRPCVMPFGAMCPAPFAPGVGLPWSWSGTWAGQYEPDGYGMTLGQAIAFPFVACGLGPIDDCGRVLRYALHLPYLPVRSVVGIDVEGVALDPAAWRWLPGTNLVARIDGNPWPSAQDLGAPAGDPSTWALTFTFGWDLPPGVGRRIAGVACELTRACLGLPCQLPEGVRINTKGDQTFVQFDDYRDKGLTGFAVLDDWISLWRGNRARIRPSMSRPRRRHGASARETPWPAT